MSAIIQKICDRTGLSQDEASAVLNIVATHLKERLPAPIAAHVDGVLNGTGTGETGGLAAEAESLAKGFFGAKE